MDGNSHDRQGEGSAGPRIEVNRYGIVQISKEKQSDGMAKKGIAQYSKGMARHCVAGHRDGMEKP